MTPEDVIDVLAALDAGGIAYWVDGGWGLDALLGQQTRTHRDLDLGVRLDDVPRIETLLPQFRRESEEEWPASYASRMSAAGSWTCCSWNAAKPASFGSNLREGDEFATRRAKPAHRDMSGVARSGARASHFSLSTTITRGRPIRTAPISRR
jgi:hypothetical protein